MLHVNFRIISPRVVGYMFAVVFDNFGFSQYNLGDCSQALLSGGEMNLLFSFYVCTNGLYFSSFFIIV